ncbi:hypothetical protein A5871_003384 [Enterococcus sp. 2F9_DIV0599]|uniref:DUF5626 family protein n=1 Tax=Enterococcus sp. 2F9_DIV0599 TaxID=1834172 RepID=UPI000A340240|nr:DUF5626 family protein [Enterococcus sp. 2F9_DIV0599]OTO31735.1 hypothetical protein A5871_003384 [Enterococcus sp. 2F9_DIV0599]
MKKTLFKTLLAITVSLTLGTISLGSALTAHAEEFTSTQAIPTELSTSIDINDSHNQTIVTDHNGQYLGKLVIDKTPEIQTRSYINQPLANKTFDIKFIGVTCNFGYKVTIKNKRIVRAYGAWSNGIIWSTSLGKPYYSATTSGVKGHTKFGYKDFSFNTTVRLTGNIKGNRLITNISLS